MTVIILKIVGIIIFGALGIGLWRQGNAWKTNGEIPKDWVEAREPKPVLKGEPGFGSAIVWQKAMGVMCFAFAGFFVLSIIFQLMGLV
jgi:hypothetical protein